MPNNTKWWPSIVLVLAAVLVLTVAPTTSSAQTSSFTVISPDTAEEQTGMTYGEWSAAWWQYVLSKSVKDPNNPLLDQTGEQLS